MKKNRKTGFTLVELLVVIAIIALLLSILIPSMNRAKESAKRILCGNGLRQVGSGMSMYVDAYDNKMPADYSVIDGVEANESHPYVIYRADKQYASKIDPVTHRGYPFRLAYLFERKFVPEGRLFYCPNNKDEGYRYDSYINPPPWATAHQVYSLTKGDKNDWIRCGYFYCPMDPNPDHYYSRPHVPGTPRVFSNLDTTRPYITDTMWSRNGMSHKAGVRRSNGKIVLVNPGINALFKDGHVVYCANREVFALGDDTKVNKAWEYWDPSDGSAKQISYQEFVDIIYKLIQP